MGRKPHRNRQREFRKRKIKFGFVIHKSTCPLDENPKIPIERCTCK